MVKKEQILQLLINAIEEINESQSPDQKIEKSLETILFGKQGALDSLGLVNLIVAVEQQIEEVFDEVLILADERAMSQTKSPFRSIEVFVDYILTRLEEERASS